MTDERKSGPLSQAARDVLAERQRQIDVEGWTPEHDDGHADREMAKAAACYAVGNNRLAVAWLFGRPHRRALTHIWPWSDQWWKPGDTRRNLIKAGALILAEIERLDRATLAKARGEPATHG